MRANRFRNKIFISNIFLPKTAFFHEFLHWTYQKKKREKTFKIIFTLSWKAECLSFCLYSVCVVEWVTVISYFQVLMTPSVTAITAKHIMQSFGAWNWWTSRALGSISDTEHCWGHHGDKYRVYYDHFQQYHWSQCAGDAILFQTGEIFLKIGEK